MTTLKLIGFSGEVPRVDEHLLEPNQAAASINTKLFSGALKAWNAPKQIKSLTRTGTVQTIYRMLKDGYTDIWLEWNNKVNVVHSPIVSTVVSHRIYYTGDGVPKQTWYELISGGSYPHPSDWKRLGVPKPVAAPTVTPSGGTASNVTRFYTYTYVTAMGEEGPPATPTKGVGASDGTWAIAAMSTGLAAEYNITKKRIYRTVVGEMGVDFFFVTELDVATTSYNDTNAESLVALNETLRTQTWFPPPDDLECLTEMPNGVIAGCSGKNIYFCEPYQPHAWPEQYRITLPFSPKGMGVVGNSLVVATEGAPYVITGSDPAAMSVSKIPILEPCISDRSIVSSQGAVMYVSPNGLMAISPGGAEIVTRQFYTRDEWRTLHPELLFATMWDNRYVALRDVTPPSEEEGGIIVDPLEPRSAVSALDMPFFTALLTDHETGVLYGVHRDLGIVEFDADPYNTLFFSWKSKLFVTDRPLNFGAVRVDADFEAIDDVTDMQELVAFVDAQNALLYASLPAVGYEVNGFEVNQINPVTVLYNYAYPLTWTPAATDPALAEYVRAQGGMSGGTRLVPQPSVVVARQVLLEVWAGHQLMYSGYVSNTNVTRLPSGVKTDHWQLRLSGNFAVYSLVMGETGKELRTV